MPKRKDDLHFLFQVKKRYNLEFLDIKLKNNRIRLVSQIDKMGELKEYIGNQLNLPKSGAVTLPS